MSRRTVVIITDDLNEHKAAVTTRTFAVDNTIYEVDLSDESSAHLDDTFMEFVKVARIVDSLHPEQDMREDETLGGLTRREYNTRMRNWAESVGRGDEITGKGNGTYYYPVAIRNDYAAHLRELAGRLA